MRRVLVSLVIGDMVVALSARVAGAQTSYRRAVVDSEGQLRLTTTTGRTIVPPKDSGQVAFDEAAISLDHRRVGWLALYPNCCTTYPVPLKLVVRTAERGHTFEGNGLPIWQWAFLADGKRVAYRQAPVHGAAPAHYELYDLETGHLVSTFDVAADSGGAVPRWVQAVSPPNDSRKPE